MTSSTEFPTPTPSLQFKSEDLRHRLEPLCRAVLSQFRLPALRLLCYFDDEGPVASCRGSHMSFHGIHIPTKGSGDDLPHYVTQQFREFDEFVFDNVIYIPESCYSRNEVGFVIIFAHELRHFIQWAENSQLYRANTYYLRDFEHAPEIRVWHVPYEFDAMMVSKNVAENVLGAKAVEEFINAQLRGGDSAKKDLWEFYRGLSTSTPSNWSAQTISLVERNIDRFRALEQNEVDFTKDEWSLQNLEESGT
jgi:hypothetical protein